MCEKRLCLRHSCPSGGVHPTVRRVTVMHGGRVLRTAALMTSGKTIGGYATFAERRPETQAKKSFMWYSQIVVHILETASMVQSRMLNVLTVQKYTLGGSSDADVAMEDSIRDVNTATQEIKVMQDMLRAIPPGELEDEKANIEAKIAAAKRDIPLFKPLPAQLSACIAALERATARR